MTEEEARQQLKYAQQHLANERTYLAWIRTAISVVGVGFLATSLHFTIGNIRDAWIDLLSVTVGVFACIFGFVIILSATENYKRKRQAIIEEKFHPSDRHITLISTMLGMMILLILLYFFLLF